MNTDFMTSGELCQYLKISLSTVYKLSHRNVLPKYRPAGRKIYFLKSDVDQYLTRNRISSIDELNAEIDRDNLKVGRLTWAR